MSTKVQGTEIKRMHKAVKWNGMYVHVSLEEETLCAMCNMCVSVCVCRQVKCFSWYVCVQVYCT